MSQDKTVDGKRIAKNTLLLYVRMLLSLFISLYTSRIVLNALGVDDYGLYNVVGGVIALFSIVANSLNSSTSRFLTVELGRGDIPRMREVFSNCNTLYLILGLIIILLEETIGLFIVNKVLVIPDTRLFACNILYQTIVLSSFITLFNTPSSALIISYERMNVYAYIGVAEIIAKLIVAVLLSITLFDKIITLAILNFFITVGISSWRAAYCKRKISHVFNFHFQFDRPLFKSMIGFSFWNLIGSAAYVLRIQGVNILLNVFFGAAVNAANAISYQVNGAINGFVSNFTLAVNPQITKSCASGDYENMKNLVFYSGKFSFYLLMFLCLPIIFETDFILHIWLGQEVPDYTAIMTKLVLIIAMVESFTYSIGCAVNATGRIKGYQIVVCGIMLTIFPITWIVFKLGALPYYGLVVYLITSIAALLSRFYFMEKLLGIHAKDYARNVYAHTLLVACASLIAPLFVFYFLPEGVLRFIVVTITIELSNVVCIWFLGLSKHDKQFVRNVINKQMKRIHA